MEDNNKKDEAGSVYSSSDSESDVEDTVETEPQSTSNEVLTLVDDENATLLIQPIEDDGEGAGEGSRSYSGLTGQYEYEGEGEEGGLAGDNVDSSQITDLALTKDGDKKKKKKKRKKWLHICLTNCKYDIVRKMSRKFGFKEVTEDDSDWTLYWTDYSVALERVMDMKRYQKINHFPGMNEICRKDLLSRNLNRMHKLFPKEYNVFPKTWCLPADHGDFLSYTRQKKNKTYILKPESGCQGKGIWVTKNPKEVKPHEHQICQVYLNKPFLIDGFKFDFRLYVVVTSCDPLRIFVFKDGLARFATHKYSEPTNNNSDNVYMHLTNYAINKHSSDFIRDDDEAGSKRRITTIMRYLREKGHNVDKLWDDIDDVITKTLISAHSVLKHNYRTCFPNHVKGSACFEILGFDILLDRKLRPLVLEVNHSPSFSTDAQIDRDIKGALVWDTLNIVNFGACDRRKCIEEEKKRIKDRLMGKYTKKETKEELEVVQSQFLIQQEKYEGNHCGNLRRIYPKADCEKYDKFFQSSGTLFQETAAFKARSEMARQQREEISRKKEKLEAMLKGKKKDGLRPESPTSRKRRTLRRTTMPSRRLTNSRINSDPYSSESTSRAESSEDVLDTKHPMDILEEEELERISGLLQRDNLVRGLGIVEHVYRLLHCTPGTMGALKTTDPRNLNGPVEFSQRRNVSGRSGESFLASRPPAIRIKDRQYYKKLLDRYFGSNHVLSNDSVMLKYEKSYRNLTLPCASPGSGLISSRSQKDSHVSRHFPNVRLSYSSAAAESKLMAELDRMEERERGACIADSYSLPESDDTSSHSNQPPYTTSMHNAQNTPKYSHLSTSVFHNTSAPSASALPYNTSSSSNSVTVPTSVINVVPVSSLPFSSHMQSSSSSSNTNARPSSYSVSSTAVPFVPFSVPLPMIAASSPGKSVPLAHSHSLNSFSSPSQYNTSTGTRWHKTGSLNTIIDRSALTLQRNKLSKKPFVGRGGAVAVLPESDYRSMMENDTERASLFVRSSNDWRQDLISPTQKTRTVSAQAKHDSEVSRFSPHLASHGLSVVSGPAPVIQRPDLAVRQDLSSPHSALSRISSNHSVTDSPTRSTKSQRIRGASNNLRLRQMEMRESHAIVHS